MKRFLLFLLICFFTIKSEHSTKYLISHINKSIENAINGISKLNNDILNLGGFSSARVRHLLNNICSLQNGNYLEIGTWAGSTFVSALFGNKHLIATAIDDFSEFGGPKKTFFDNISKFLEGNTFNFIEHDCFKINLKNNFKKPVNIYFYDGNHDIGSQEMAFTYFNEILSDYFIAIVDDYDADFVRAGTQNAFKKLNYKILFEKHLRANHTNDSATWWGGIYIALIKK